MCFSFKQTISSKITVVVRAHQKEKNGAAVLPLQSWPIPIATWGQPSKMRRKTTRGSDLESKLDVKTSRDPTVQAWPPKLWRLSLDGRYDNWNTISLMYLNSKADWADCPKRGNLFQESFLSPERNDNVVLIIRFPLNTVSQLLVWSNKPSVNEV